MMTREQQEKAQETGRAWTRLEITDDYVKSLGAWLDAQVEQPLLIDVDNIKKPELLEQNYWMLLGRRAMLYTLMEQIARWRAESRIEIGADTQKPDTI